MEIQEIATLIGQMGFPIACCIYMGVFLRKALEELKEAMQNNTGAIREMSIYMNDLRKEHHNEDDLE